MVPISAPFANQEQQLLLLAEVAETFGCRPSALLRGPATDLQIDLACAAMLWRERASAAQQLTIGD
jgi:hypothetical protein